MTFLYVPVRDPTTGKSISLYIGAVLVFNKANFIGRIMSLPFDAYFAGFASQEVYAKIGLASKNFGERNYVMVHYNILSRVWELIVFNDLDATKNSFPNWCVINLFHRGGMSWSSRADEIYVVKLLLEGLDHEGILEINEFFKSVRGFPFYDCERFL